MSKSKLVGDVRCENPDPDIAENFLIELELLMLRFKVDKVDVSWGKFK